MTKIPARAARTAVAGLALAAATGLAAASPAAATTRPSTVVPLTGSGCNYAHLAATECTTVTGSGLKITSITATAYNNLGVAVPDSWIELYGPNGYITKTAAVTMAAHGGIGPSTWHNPHPTTNMTPGDYCTEVYTEGSATSAECIDVHS